MTLVKEEFTVTLFFVPGLFSLRIIKKGLQTPAVRHKQVKEQELLPITEIIQLKEFFVPPFPSRKQNARTYERVA